MIVYARHYELPDEGAVEGPLCQSNLTAIHQKTRIGRLSAVAALSAQPAAPALPSPTSSAGTTKISDTITNTLANVSGILCDGAKASCAAKIASSVDAAIMGLTMAFRRLKFLDGDGIVQSNVEETMAVIGTLPPKA